MTQNDPNRKNTGSKEPIGPKHTYHDGGSKPDKADPGQRSTGTTRGPGREEPPGKIETPPKPLPDYGDTEPGDPRKHTATGGDRAQPGGAQGATDAGPGHSVQA